MGYSKAKQRDGKLAKETPKEVKRVKVQFSSYQFVQMELSNEQKAEFRALASSGEFDRIDVDGWLHEGYKLTINYDDAHTTVIASLTAQYTDMENSGLVLTARGSDFSTAVAVLYFKHRYIAPDQLWRSYTNTRDRSADDIG